MKKQFTLCAFLITFFIAFISGAYSQENTVSSYHYAKVLLKSGKVFHTKAKHLQLTADSLRFPMKTPDGQKFFLSMPLSEVDAVMGAHVNKASIPIGIAIGTGVGLLAMHSVEKNYEKPKTTVETFTSPGVTTTVTTTIKKKMAPGKKLLIATSGTALGAIVGSFFLKGAWQEIFPANPLSNTISIDFYSDVNMPVGAAFSIRF